MSARPSESYAYLTTRQCGCFTGVCVDDQQHAEDTARFVGNAALRGDRIERMPVEIARPRLFTRCDTHPEAAAT